MTGRARLRIDGDEWWFRDFEVPSRLSREAASAEARPDSTIVVGLVRVWVAAALVVGPVACASTTSRTAPASAATASVPDTKVELLPPAVDLSGNWTTGSGNEPPPGPVVHHASCTRTPPVWILEQAGNTLQALLIPERLNQGIVRPGPGPVKPTASPGTISGADVVIDDGRDRFVLRYDAESGHLRGTRNGAPFWAARQIVERPEPCLGVPRSSSPPATSGAPGSARALAGRALMV